jgi:hypothetical protein
LARRVTVTINSRPLWRLRCLFNNTGDAFVDIFFTVYNFINTYKSKSVCHPHLILFFFSHCLFPHLVVIVQDGRNLEGLEVKPRQLLHRCVIGDFEDLNPVELAQKIGHLFHSEQHAIGHDQNLSRLGHLSAHHWMTWPEVLTVCLMAKSWRTARQTGK